MKNRSNTYFINIIKNNGPAIDNLHRFLLSDAGNNYNRLSNLLIRNQQLKLSYPIFISSFDNIRYPFYLKGLSFSKLLEWYCNVIKVFEADIKVFYQLKIKFEGLFLKGEYKAAAELCEDIKNRFGYSMWLLDGYSLLESFGEEKQFDYSKTLDEYGKAFLNILKQKNRVTERSGQFKNRINYTLSKLEPGFSKYLKYKTLCEIPNSSLQNIQEDWADVLFWEGNKSIIDVFLSTVDCLHFCVVSGDSTPCIRRCVDLISSIDIPICKLIAQPEEECSNQEKEYLTSLIQNDYPQFTIDYDSFQENAVTSFSAFRVLAISKMHSNNANEKDADTVETQIINCICEILSKSAPQWVREKASMLKGYSRALRSFEIHKGLCVFLDVATNDRSGYLFGQRFSSVYDAEIEKLEINNSISASVPFFALSEYYDGYDTNEWNDIIKQNIEKYNCVNYYKSALLRLALNELFETDETKAATDLFVHAATENPFLVTTVKVDKIVQHVFEIIKKEESISLEELYYIFLDSHFEAFRKSCFLNYLDFNGMREPLDVLDDAPELDKLKELYLAAICDTDMLYAIYWLFDDSDSAIEYRMKICQELIKRNSEFAKELKLEFEELTKKRVLKERLINVDKSRVAIDSDSIQKETVAVIEEQIDVYNEQLSKQVISLPNEKQSTVVLMNTKSDACSCMYSSYAKVFCFGSNGLDTSLSTRVRHGAFANQLLRTFADNNLIYGEHSQNAFFENLIMGNKVNAEIGSLLSQLNEKIREKLNYFTQHTLKVFIDEPIEGAVFDYSATEYTEYDIMLYFVGSGVNNTLSATRVLHSYLIDMTNTYLKEIREKHLPELESSLIESLTLFSNDFKQYSTDDESRKEIERKITQCKSELQSEFMTVKEWFYLSESEVWENFSFNDLINLCSEITRKLFSGFDQANMSNSKGDLVYKGKAFRYLTDIVLILLNNATLHSGFGEEINGLEIVCTETTDDQYSYFSFENNLHRSIDLKKLKKRIEKINDDYKNRVYESLNTRQEGGMGLYKVMLMLSSKLNAEDAFYMALENHKVKVTIKLKKESICCEENIVS